jgi:xylan 1,4-beta-xylosidase
VKSVSVDFSRVCGRIKPVHGINNGPLDGQNIFDFSDDYKEIGFPYVRLHDTGGNVSRYLVDVSRIFPNFDADENDPKNYWFEHTDDLIRAIKNTGAKVIYRLGESIDHGKYKRFARPPKDFDKWVRICLHIVMHYNEGWAGGFRDSIEYWEIWNEPECDGFDNLNSPMWSGGSEEQALELYEKAAVALKEHDPKLKIGGMAFVYPNIHLENFVRRCAERKLPLDFLSFHGYFTDPAALEGSINSADAVLKKYGFDKTERIFDEWNYVGLERPCEGSIWKLIRDLRHAEIGKEVFENQKNMVGASFTAACMIRMNSLPVDIACYYDGQPTLTRWCGLYDKYGLRRETFWSFKAYGEIYKECADRAVCGVFGEGVYALAGKGAEAEYVLISCYRGNEEALELTIEGSERTRFEVFTLKPEKGLVKTGSGAINGQRARFSVEGGRYSLTLVKCK